VTMKRYLCRVAAVLLGVATLAAAVATFVQWYVAIFAHGERQAQYANSGFLTLLVAIVLGILTVVAGAGAME
jgi:uncharacterized membrane protein YphA (DoxX/SURF4 family)